MKVGVLELLISSASGGWIEQWHNRRFKRQLASITPQAVAVWCRELGHEVTYATYYGQDRPDRLLPDDLDVVFVSAFTQASALAYAVAKLYRRRGTRTVIGGPHARSFPVDCRRFFDIVVGDCDRELVDDILRGHIDPPAIVGSGRPLTDIPSVEERLPEIITAAFPNGRRRMLSNVPMLSSIGCPYRCDFCVDWDNPFTLLPLDRLARDLQFVATRLPGAIVSFHDPNFAVKFDEVMAVMESVPAAARSPYIMGSSLTILRGPRLQRLRETNCGYLAPGIESWAEYSNKAGVGRQVGWEKMVRVADHFQEIHECVPGLGACFVFGTAADAGGEPIDLTIEFFQRVPFVWPQFNIPMPYGGTPMFDEYVRSGRILTAMPFAFYYTPYLVATFEHYGPVEYYDQLIRFYRTVTSARMLTRRVLATRRPDLKALQVLRTLSMRDQGRQIRRLRNRIAADPGLRAFHDGRSPTLPPLYRHLYRKRLGPFAELMTDGDMQPVLAQCASETRVTEHAPVLTQLRH